ANKMKQKIKPVLVVLGVCALLFSFFSSAIIGEMLWAFAVIIALMAHLISDKAKEVKAPAPQPTPQPEAPIEDAQKKEFEERKKKVEADMAQLNKEMEAKQATETQQEQTKEAPKGVICPICQKECKNKLNYTRHIAFKHPSNIKLEFEKE
ncbi:unnamed protein product, partial [marine sediment metagenome]